MDFWNTRRHSSNDSSQDTGQDDRASEPTFLEKLGEYAKEEAMAKVVETLSGGWITMEYDDADEPQPHKRGEQQGSFEERLQRRLAELDTQATGRVEPPLAGAGEATMPVQPAPIPPVTTAATARPTAHRAQGFGRKGL